MADALTLLDDRSRLLAACQVTKTELQAEFLGRSRLLEKMLEAAQVRAADE